MQINENPKKIYVRNNKLFIFTEKDELLQLNIYDLI